MDGEENADYSGEEEDVLVGEGYMFPEVEEALVGMETGEEKTVQVTLTEDFAEEEDVGKTISVEVKVNDISVENVPEYNDDFVKENTDYDNTEEYEASIRSQLESEKEEEYKYAAAEEIMTYVVENSTYDGYPQELYDQCKEDYDYNNEYYASLYGMELEDFIDTFGLDEETQEAEILDNVHYELVVGAIAQAEGISCSEEDIANFVGEIYEDYGYDSADEMRDDYTDDVIGFEIIYENVVDFLYDNATYVEMSEEEYLAQQEEEYDEEDSDDTEDEDTDDDADEDTEDADTLDNEIQDGAQGDTLDVEVEDVSSQEETTEEETTEATTEEETTEKTTTEATTEKAE
jgi:trigger factor